MPLKYSLIMQEKTQKKTNEQNTLAAGYTPSKQNGFSLIEVLVSVLMISFGLLSLTNLQTGTVNRSTAAYSETQVMLHLQELVEVLRANKVAASNGDFNVTDGAFDTVTIGSSIPEIDNYRWFNNLNSALPGATASVNCDNTAQCVLELNYHSSGIEKAQSLAVIL